MKPFSYELPSDRIAQRPVAPYDSAKMLVVDRAQKALTDNVFTNLASLLQPNDCLVFNDSRVIPARLFGENEATGGKVELLLVEEESRNSWRCLAKPLKKCTPGTRFLFQSETIGEVKERVGDQYVTVDFSGSFSSFQEYLWKNGLMPIPPYIREGRSDAQDKTDYQSMFAEKDGSIAAPTASLHFTPDLMESLTTLGCKVMSLTLHVGPASFLPLWKPRDSQELEFSPPGEERFVYSSVLLEELACVRENGGKIVAVGTTVVRALETMARIECGTDLQQLHTDLFIEPGFEFQLVDALITNFHQPRTTHLLLVEAFIGAELLERSYGHALSSDYRFLSYGDGMLLL